MVYVGLGDKSVFAEKIKSLIKEYFINRGMELLIKEEQPVEIRDKYDLVFREGNNIVVVRIFSPLTNLIKDEFRETYITALRQASGKVNKIYIAIPSNIPLVRLASPKELKASGIGIIVVNREIKEKIPPRPMPTIYYNISIEKDLLEEAMKKIENIEILINNLKKRIEKLERNILPASSEPSPQSTETVKLGDQPSIDLGGEVPDFLRDNPWLKVLSKKNK